MDKKELQELRQKWTSAQNFFGDGSAPLGLRLLDHIDALELDKQRLDFLIKEGCSVECGRHVGKYFLLWAQEYNACETQIGDFDTARDAIDAAIASAQDGKNG